MELGALATTVLRSPLTWAGVTLVVAPLAAWIVLLQLKALGLERRIHQRGLPWDLAIAFLVFWIVLTMGISAVAERAALEGLHWAAHALSGTVLGLLPPVLILAAASHYRRLRLDEAQEWSKEALEAARQDLRWLQPAAGVAAALALLGSALIWKLLLVAVAAGVLFLVLNAKARERVKALWGAMTGSGGEPGEKL